jgi:hypothetical protein
VGDVFPIAVGWILGIASTLGVERYNESRRRRRFIDGLRIELGRLQAVMAILFWNLTDRAGTGAREDIQWVLSRSRRAPDDEAIVTFRNKFEKALGFSDEQIAALMAASARERLNNALSLRTYDLPFLETHLSELAGVRDSKAVTQILHTRSQLKVFNEIVEEAREYQRLTFTVVGDNHKRAMTNVEGAYTAIRRRAKWIADSIESCLDSGLLGDGKQA